MSVRQQNESYFRFLRRRQGFVVSQAQQESIEGYVVWGAAVDALSRIHARRVEAKLTSNRACFVRGLLDLAPGYQLGNVSIPLLYHDLQFESPGFEQSAVFLEYRCDRRVSRIWQVSKDKIQTPPVRMLQEYGVASGLVQQFISKNTYAEILYEEYRCCAVHGLELGRKTCQGYRDQATSPYYLNYHYDDGDPRQPKYRYGTRIVFPLLYLAEILEEMIRAEENACVTQGWTISPYPTLTD